MGSQEGRTEGDNHLPLPPGHPSSDAAQDAVGLLDCKHALLAHIQLFIHQKTQLLPHRTALNEFFSLDRLTTFLLMQLRMLMAGFLDCEGTLLVHV